MYHQTALRQFMRPRGYSLMTNVPEDYASDMELIALVSQLPPKSNFCSNNLIYLKAMQCIVTPLLNHKQSSGLEKGDVAR